METEELDEVDAVPKGRKMGFKRKPKKAKVAIKTVPLVSHVPDPPPPAPNERQRLKNGAAKITKIEDARDKLEKEIADITDVAIQLDDETAEAHNLFLFGKNGRRPIRSLSVLAHMTGVPLRKLEIVAPAWKREALRLAREASPLFAMASTTKARVQHSHDLDRMRQDIDAYAEAMPEVTHRDFPSKSRHLMLMRKEWQDAAGITSAINISQAMLLMEGKAMLEKAGVTKEGEEAADLSAFDLDVEQVG